MSGQAVIDSLEFARAGQHLTGSVPVAAMTRLEEVLYDSAGECRYEIAGGLDAKGRPMLQVRVGGALNLRCQRCLGPVGFPLALEENLLLGSEREASLEGAENDDPDWIVADRELDVAALIEDEVLLALPMVVRHADGECSAALPGEAASGAERTSPFAALTALKRD